MKVKELLPHREPFIFIDNIIDIIPDKSSITSRVVKNDEFWIEGHFPGNPIFPGVLLLETMAQGGGILFNNDKDEHNTINYNVFLTKVTNLKFIRPVYVGDEVIVKGTFLSKFENFRTVKTEAFVNKKKVAGAIITYVMSKKL